MDSLKQSDFDCSNDDQYRYNCLEELPLAMAYIPWQQWRKVSCADKGLACGTIFEELILPFHCGAINSSCNPCERRCDRK